MPLYFFQLEDGASPRDRDGTQLPDMDAARRHAARQFGALLAAEPERFWRSEEWTMVVSDAAGLTLFSLSFSAMLAPAARPLLQVVRAARG
jgi:hypothetical protein